MSSVTSPTAISAGPTMRDLVTAELYKAVTGRTWLVVGLVGALLAVLAVAGYSADAKAAVEAGAPMADVTAEAIRFWFTVVLSSILMGALLVTREYGNGSIARSTLLAGNRMRLFWAKVLAGTIVGVGYAVATVVAMLLSTVVLVPLTGSSAEWSGEATRTTAGVAFVVIAGAPWGVAFGWLLRNSAAAVGTLLLLTLIVDEGLFRLLPTVGRFTMQIAMGAIYLDGKPDMLPVPAALVVVIMWTGALLAVARWRVGRSDVL